MLTDEQIIDDAVISRTLVGPCDEISQAWERIKSRLAKKSKKKPLDDNSAYFPLAACLADHIKVVSREAIIGEGQLKAWCKDFRLMVDRDKRTTEQIYDIIGAVFADDFWRTNIRSAAKLRLRWNEGKLTRLTDSKCCAPSGRIEFHTEPLEFSQPGEQPLDEEITQGIRERRGLFHKG
jgi:hypothetical protein